MSGGSMDYLSYKVEEASFRLKTPERKAFKEHLQKVANAMHIIEWNDSGDGAEGENEAIRDCLVNDAVLQTLTKEADEILKLLQDELKKIKNNP